MNNFNKEDVKALLNRVIETHKEVDLKVVAHIFVNHKIIRDMIEKENLEEYKAYRQGINEQSNAEDVLISYAKELEKQGKVKLNIASMMMSVLR